MNYFFKFVYPLAIYLLIPLIILCIIIRIRWHKVVRYRFPLTSTLHTHGIARNYPFQKIVSVLRVLALLILAFLIAKPQIVDTHSKVTVEGIDIVLCIDISGSMQMQDDPHDKRPRVEIAKTEAIRFIEKRTNDALGLVIFGQDAVSRCPLTLDKHVIRALVSDLSIGTLDPQGTMLSTAIISAVNRLKVSKAKSKVIILLTDGEPSEGDIDPAIAIEAAKRLGIKIYTIGVGSDKPTQIITPHGFLTVAGVNTELLSVIAKETGGKFFMARNAQDMRAIYDTIDTLEKTTTEAPVFSNYWDIFIPFVWIVIVLLILEMLLSTFVWFSL